MIKSEWDKLTALERSLKENELLYDASESAATYHSTSTLNVNKPPHYGMGTIECIDYIEDFLTKEEFIGYLRGNIAKYLHRWRYKNKQEDLLKSQWYLDRLILLNGKDST
tara:strand:- start:186 stop:515 length:330 start_codon:yes stop_codon:yes gene_type:complete